MGKKQPSVSDVKSEASSQLLAAARGAGTGGKKPPVVKPEELPPTSARGTAASAIEVPAKGDTAVPAVKRISLLASQKIMRLEAEEHKILTEALYSRPDGNNDDFFKREPLIPVQSTKEKLEGFKKFVGLLGDPTNRHVLRVFLTVSVAMLTLPVAGLYAGMHLVTPLLGPEYDKETVGGLTAVAVSVVVMFGYVIYALQEDTVFDERAQMAQMQSEKKRR